MVTTRCAISYNLHTKIIDYYDLRKDQRIDQTLLPVMYERLRNFVTGKNFEIHLYYFYLIVYS